MVKEVNYKSIKRISALSVGYIVALIYLVLGLAEGLIFSLTLKGLSPDQITDKYTAVLASIGWWNIILFPILFVIMGFVVGVIFAAFYNLFAKITGGIKIEII